MTHFSDAEMRERLTQSREYTVVLLEAGPKYGTEEAGAIIWEHGRRNFELRADGVLNIVCPIADDTPLCGMGIFSGTPDEVRRIMDDDPGVRAGVFTYRVHPARSFPGDSLR
jgi:hypothetical protein